MSAWLSLKAAARPTSAAQVLQEHPPNSRALKETLLWCSKQSFSAQPVETEDTLRRRGMIAEAGKLMRKGKYPGREWSRAIELIGEVKPESLALLEDQLRSSELKPHDDLGRLQPESACEKIVSSVIRMRSKLVASFEQYLSREDQAGRFLIYTPSENVSDGASRYSSHGFFDHLDAPPWDLWIHYAERDLISWVPERLVPLAQEGIDANPVDCIRWADSRFRLPANV